MDPRPNRDARPLRAVEAAQDAARETGGHVPPLAEGVPLAQVIPRELLKAPDLVLLSQPRSAAAEKIRRLKTKLHNELKDELQVVVVTSAAPGEGKSMLAFNLALAFAADFPNTLLIDADLRRPSVQRWLNPAPALGLSEVLRGEVGVSHAFLSLKDSPLTVMVAGTPIPEPGNLLASEAFQSLIAEGRSRFERIIIDTPPILPFTDADVIGRCADGVLLVVRARKTFRRAFAQAVSLVTSTRIVGTVLNDARSRFADLDHHYNGYYDHYYTRDKEKP